MPSDLYRVTLDDIRAARERIAGRVKRTQLISSASLSQRLGTNTYLKLELFQKTGAFKVRGAFNKALASGVKPGTRVVAVSGGNHAQAVAYMSSQLGLHATIYMPQTSPKNYVNATLGYGAHIEFVTDIMGAFNSMAEEERKGAIGIHPFDDPLVMAGQGTMGLEILDDLPETTDVIVSIGGGGLIGGVSSALKAAKPSVRVWGVETIGADAMSQAMAAGHPVTLPAITSIAKTLGAPAVSATTLAIAKENLESVTVVPDSEALEAMAYLMERTKLLTEAAASCTLAAADRLRANFGPNSHVVLLLCGGNIGVDDLCKYRQA